uniref:tRNA-specific 2-thiouridylase MnmA n=1 Tax=candidate division WOR-3 bacterium TaxID=2052148 RepID=A0A7C4CBJ3_UNCW3
MKVVAALSGGVDSAVAAALLKEQGFDVIGVTMRLYEDGPERSDGRGCCGSRAVREARRVAALLKIPFYALDFRQRFSEDVIEPFCNEYEQGRTPNPCIRCNEGIKFGALLERARELGAERVATGHYARIAWDDSGGRHLLKGADSEKEQSYFLHVLTQEQLMRTLFPVGDLKKRRVREIARELGLPNADRPESQEICFVPDDDYARFLKARRPGMFRPGPVLDTAGNVLGEHKGIAGFTVGQRKGLGIALGERRYVVRIDAAANAVVLGREDEARARVVVAERVNWIAGRPPLEAFWAVAKVRYQGEGGRALVEPLADGMVCVVFDEPQWAPTPGQAVVFWQGEELLGGGTIVETRRE